jgi:hypothetical protein
LDGRLVRASDIQFVLGDIDPHAEFVMIGHAETLPCKCELACSRRRSGDCTG